MDKRLQVGIDFSHKKADVCLMFPQGELLEPHLSFPNSLTGFGQLKSVLLDARDAYVFDGIDISGEATGYYWMPLFLRLADDPDLTEAALDLFLLNPRWLKWFKKSFPPDDKTDQKDPFYIAERTRTRRPAFTWQPQLETLSLRFYTRYRFHLAQDLTREKNYFTALLFLKLSAYRQFKPFSNTFGVTSSLILSGQLDLDELAQLPLDILAERLTQLSGNRLPEVDKNALKLHDALQHSFPLPPALLPPIQDVLNLTMQHIRFIQQQMTTTETHITAELEKHPAIQKLATIPGVGLIFASGIGAELGDTKRFLQGTKSLSEKFGCAKGNPGAGEMKHSQVVFDFLLPTDKQAAETIEPGMGALYHPTPRPVGGYSFFLSDFLPASADMGGVSPFRQNIPDLIIVISLIKAHILRLLFRWLRSVYHHRLQSCFRQLHIVPVRPGSRHRNGDTVTFRQQTALRAYLPPVSGVAPGGLTTQWRFGHRSIHRLPFPSQPFFGVVLQQPGLPHLLKHSCLTPLLKTVVDGTRSAQVARQGFPLTPRAKHVENGVHCLPVSHPGTTWLFLWLLGRQQRLDALPQFIGNPVVRANSVLNSSHLLPPSI